MDDWERREAEWWRERPEPIPARQWVPGLLAFLFALVIIDGLTFYGLWLLGCLLHRVIFG